MNKKFSFLLIILGYPLLLFSQNQAFDESVRKYIEKYKDIAIQEMMIYRIPASITLAQGILESNAGISPLATEANNHFGIKCHKEWQGITFIKDDETRNECFRKYDHAEESFRDHSFFLTQRDRYKPLFDLDICDYKGWANGLKRSGYATNPTYSDQLIKTIEKYSLCVYDLAELSLNCPDSARVSPETPVLTSKAEQVEVVMEGPGYRKILVNNGVKYIIAQKGDNMESLAREFGSGARQFDTFNDLKKGASVVPGQVIYIEGKRRKGAASFHTVKRGETMYTIAQKHGIQLKMLYRMNKIKTGQAVKPGKKLLLR
ncbi:MAG: glucosaminidase domain-containing protein [Bacteroidetes bacterium]|nr:glucosaminidase domain-containing protein [Bacteroidota bacterium]